MTSTLLAEAEKKRIKAFENRCFRKLPRISYFENNRMTVYGAKRKVSCTDTNLSHPLFSFIRCHCFATSHDIIASAGPSCKTLLKAPRKQGRQRKSSADNNKELADMTMAEYLRATTNKSTRRRYSVSFNLRSRRRLKQSSDWWQWWWLCWWWQWYKHICSITRKQDIHYLIYEISENDEIMFNYVSRWSAWISKYRFVHIMS